MNDLSPQERLHRVLHKQSVDRPPVICPGGMMNSATVDVMDSCQLSFPEVHADVQKMITLSSAVQHQTGFENFGIPFCMTVEAEVLGSVVDFGNHECEPKIAKEIYGSFDEVVYEDIGKLVRHGRLETVAKAGASIAQANPDIPVIGSLTGPISTAASVVDPLVFLKGLRKDKEQAHRYLTYVTDFLIAYADLLIDNGYKFITIADPTATGNILGPRMFGDYAVPYLNRLTDAIHARGADVIIHICGQLNSVKQEVAKLHSDAISTDAMVPLSLLKAEFPELTVMGNVSTLALEIKDAEFIQKRTEQLVRSGVDIIAPACGLSTTTPVKNIAVMTGTVQNA